MIRDKETKALISTDVVALNKYKVERNQIRKIADLEKRIMRLEKIVEMMNGNNVSKEK